MSGEVVPDVRLILETLAVTDLGDPEPTLDGPEPPPARPLFAAILRPGEAIFVRDPIDIADLRRSGQTLYRVRTEWDPHNRVHAPRLDPGAVTRA